MNLESTDRLLLYGCQRLDEFDEYLCRVECERIQQVREQCRLLSELSRCTQQAWPEHVFFARLWEFEATCNKVCTTVGVLPAGDNSWKVGNGVELSFPADDIGEALHYSSLSISPGSDMQSIATKRIAVDPISHFRR